MRFPCLTALRVALVLLMAGLLVACGHSEEWTDEALMHDGKVVDVHRTVAFHHGSGELSEAFREYPDQFMLEVVNPSTGKRVRWTGERRIRPMLLDFVDGVPYLVVVSDWIYRYGSSYGCPEIPYAFLRYDADRWTPIARNAAPAILKVANLSMEYPSILKANGKRRQSANDIAELNSGKDFPGSFDSARIPNNFGDWSYRDKELFSNTRFPDDCRSPMPRPVDSIAPDSPAPPSTPVKLEVLESKSFDPPRSMSHDEWSQFTWNMKRSTDCKGLLMPADRNHPELRTYSAFIKNPNRLTRNAMWICDEDALWVGDYRAEKGRIVLIKANAIGDVLYRISFDRPLNSSPYSGFISQSSLREESGYLYFDWTVSTGSGDRVALQRLLKLRVPVSQAR